MAEKILSLSTTEFDRPVVMIDGEPYKMRAAEELTVAMQREIIAAAKVPEEDLGVESGENLESTDRRLSRQVDLVMVDIPLATLEKLSPVQKGQILRVFTQRVTAAISGEEPTMAPPSGSRGASDSSAAH